MTAIASAPAAVAPVAADPRVATDLRPEALIARVAASFNTVGKAEMKRQHIACNALALLFLNANDLDRNNVTARADAWRNTAAALREACNDVGFTVAGPALSMLRRVLTLDVTGQYLTPWSKGDFTVSLREAYDALAPIAKRPAQSVEKILRAAEKKIRKLYPNYATLVQVDPDRASLTVTF